MHYPDPPRPVAFLSPPAIRREAPTPPDEASGPPEVLDVVRARLEAWGALSRLQRGRLIRDVGAAVAAELGGLSFRQIAEATGASHSGLLKSIKVFRGDHVNRPRGPAARGGATAQND